MLALIHYNQFIFCSDNNDNDKVHSDSILIANCRLINTQTTSTDMLICLIWMSPSIPHIHYADNFPPLMTCKE